ncbi:CHAT domain-containing protein, partial [Nostoc sp. NIES-2111]
NLISAGRPFDVAPSSALYSACVDTVAGLLTGSTSLAVFSDGPLRSVPFEALQGSQGWLADRFAISYPADLGIRRIPTRHSVLPSGRPPFLGIGDPTLGPPAAPGLVSRVAAALGWREGLGPLPNAARELDALRRTLGATREDVLLGNSATERAFRSHPSLSSARVIAFATHGLVAGGRWGPNDQPSLVLTATDGDDGYLTSGEIEQLRITADLVILSACDTGASDGSLGSAGLSGLARAFVAAGAGTVVATHWPVRDDAAAAFSTMLVEAWYGGMTLSEAKAHAQRRIRQASRGRFAHPVFWAGFVIVGEGDARW